MTVEELGAYLSENGESIREQLRTRKYKPQPVRRVEIPKPDGGMRNLGVPTVVDRFVQQAVAQVLTPIFEEQFHDHSYGFRPNRCAQQAVLKALEMMNDGHSWIVDIDLAKFFDTVDHDKLMTIFGRTIKDGDVISVVRKFLVSGVMIDDEYEDTIVDIRRKYLAAVGEHHAKRTGQRTGSKRTGFRPICRRPDHHGWKQTGGRQSHEECDPIY